MKMLDGESRRRWLDELLFYFSRCEFEIELTSCCREHFPIDIPYDRMLREQLALQRSGGKERTIRRQLPPLKLVRIQTTI